MQMLSAFSRPFSQTRPVVNAQNAHSSHAACKSTSAMVTVARLMTRLKNLTNGILNTLYPSPAAPRLL